MPRKTPQLFFVIAGIIFGQAVLYGPSLIGYKLLLPLDVLAAPNIYLPQTEAAGIEPHNMVLSDLVFLFEPERRFAVSEFHAGRIPLWAPYHFAGAPFIWPKFSPLLLPAILVRSPVILAWVQMLCALVAGTGMYFFSRRVLAVGLWPATIIAWCYPISYFFILSQGFTLILSVYWLPWILWAVNDAVRGRAPSDELGRRGTASLPGGAIGLSVATAFVALSGQLDMAGEVLLVSGCFGVWAWFDEHWKNWRHAAARHAAIRLLLGWSLGLMLAAPYVLPVLDYARSGARVSLRSTGTEERPPVGLAALPQTVLPKMYGSSERGDIPLYPKGQNNLQESSAGAYAGLLAALVLAPLAFCSKRHRSMNLFWLSLAFVGLSWLLNVPLIVWCMRLPGINLMSYNRLVIATAFSVLALAAVGLEAIYKRETRWRRGFWLPAATLSVLCGWCAFRAVILPEPLRTELEAGLKQGLQSRWVHDLAGAQDAKALFSRNYALAALLSAAGVAIWIVIWRSKYSPIKLPEMLASIMIVDLLWHGAGRSSQCDPALYYPRLPALEQLSQAPAGRVIGYSCLPAVLASSHGLRDIRGYDPIVPARLLDLLRISSDARSTVFAYGLAQRLTPTAAPDGQGGIRLPPVLDMLNVRYVIFRGAPSPEDRPIIQAPDYFVLQNRSAGERAFVPERVEVIADGEQRMAKLSAAEFNARRVGFVEEAVDVGTDCRGTARIAEETATKISLKVEMETPGVVVLADLWDHSWKAYLNGARVPILRVNHAIRGVKVPRGNGSVEFRYEPAAFTLGLWLAGIATTVSISFVGFSFWRKDK